MFDIFKKSDDKNPADVKVVRDTVLRSIKQELQKAEGGEGRNIKGIHLYIPEATQDRHVYEAAVFVDDPERFKDEVQKIADDYDLGLPQNWALEVNFTGEIPPEAINIPGTAAALFIRTKDNTIQRSATAYIRVLNGEAEQAEYQINSTDDKINIGREKKAQVKEGFFRHNHIAFPGNSENESNKYISRQHAHIEWNNENGSFMFFCRRRWNTTR